jgi:hypothetical protein
MQEVVKKDSTWWWRRVIRLGEMVQVSATDLSLFRQKLTDHPAWLGNLEATYRITAECVCGKECNKGKVRIGYFIFPV